jgi:hypothetical protein
VRARLSGGWRTRLYAQLLAVKWLDNTRTPGMHRLQHWTWITDDAYTPQQLRVMELSVVCASPLPVL